MVAPEDLREALARALAKGNDRVLRDIAVSGPGGTALLAEAMRRETLMNNRIGLAACLGFGSGVAGIEELRSAAKVTGPGTTDLRCASLLALAKRAGPDATEDLALALSERLGAVRQYAMMGLAAVGNGSAHETTFSLLRSWLKRPAPQGAEMNAVVYLIRARRLDRVIGLETLLRDHHSRGLATVSYLWPEVFGDKIVTEGDAKDVRHLVWTRYLDGGGRMFHGLLPRSVPTYT